MGKSGHVGLKVAATLSSTGTPAYFVHPSEASHGDLGMITSDDVILAFSWSGETVELGNIVSYSRRFAVPLIAVTSNSELDAGPGGGSGAGMPQVKEACPHGLAPTTSTLMQLALGDCLAIALLESKGFTARDFKALHPGGQLGARLKFVSDLMHKGDRLPLAARRRGHVRGHRGDDREGLRLSRRGRWRRPARRASSPTAICGGIWGTGCSLGAPARS